MNDFEHINVASNEDDLHPRRRSLLRVLWVDGNWKCFFLSHLVLGTLAIVIWLFTGEMDQEISELNSYAYAPAGFLLLVYVVYLVENFYCKARIQLSKTIDVNTITQRIYTMTLANPKVWWKAICYHYVKRKRQVTRYRHGEPYFTTQSYYERINSHSAYAYFYHERCGQVDISGELVLDPLKPITNIRFSKEFAFANMEAANEFEDQRSRFFAQHENFDMFMEKREGLELLGISSFKENVVVFRDLDQWSWYSSRLFFWAMTCFMLSWPLRIWIEYNTANVHYKITKIFGVNFELDTSRQIDADLSDSLPLYSSTNDLVPVMEEQCAELSPTPIPQQIFPMSATSTVDSLILYSAVQINCVVAPSYSEAVNIDATLHEDAEDHASEERIINVTELPRALSLDGPRVGSSTATAANESIQQNRHSWTGVFNNARINARQFMDAIRTGERISYQSIPINAEPHCSTTRGALIYSTALPPTCSSDPFGGKQQTTPIDEPPTYEEALGIPTSRRITRSISESEISGPRSGFLRDAITNRMSCLEGVGVLSDAEAQLIVRIPLHEPGMETAV